MHLLQSCFLLLLLLFYCFYCFFPAPDIPRNPCRGLDPTPHPYPDLLM